MKKITYSIIALTMIFATGNAMADSNTDNHKVTIKIPQVALVDIESSGSKDITFTATAPTEAGEKITFNDPTNSTLKLNYSSIVAPSQTRTISVKLDAPVPGINLKLTVETAESGKGVWGTGTSEFTLTATDQDAVNGIGSVYTGDGADKGSQLTYKVELDDEAYGGLVAKDHDVTVTYTITATN